MTSPVVLREGTPDEVGMDPKRLQPARDRLRAHVDGGRTPTLVAIVARRGVIVLAEGGSQSGGTSVSVQACMFAAPLGIVGGRDSGDPVFVAGLRPDRRDVARVAADLIPERRGVGRDRVPDDLGGLIRSRRLGQACEQHPRGAHGRLEIR